LIEPRYRVISDNDYSGDPDGLFQLVHLLLSPSVDVRGVIGSHLAPGDVFDPSENTALNALHETRRVIELLGSRRDIEAVAGSDRGLADTRTPVPSRGAEMIVREAMRTDTELPLFVTLGAGLTELASAYLMEPAIAGRFTAVWIGGPEHPGLGAPAFSGSDPEYNLNIDIAAARVVFNDSGIDLWQVPRNVYRQCLASMTELAARVAPAGRIGSHLYAALVAVGKRDARNLGETYILGDSPLVLLTALQSPYEPDTTSSRFALLPCPRIAADGSYEPRPDGREIRVYTRVDVRLMLEDLFAKLAQSAAVSPPST
jgi:inosine-uridine nucleoside N-ribohydrolase